MSIVPALHCPECGAETTRKTDVDGDVILYCTNDECERIIVAVVPSLARSK